MSNADFRFCYFDTNTHNLMTIEYVPDEVTFTLDGEGDKYEIAGRMSAYDFSEIVSHLSTLVSIGHDTNGLNTDYKIKFEEAEDNDICYNCEIMHVRLYKNKGEEDVTAVIAMHSHSISYDVSMPSSKLMVALDTIGALRMAFKEEL